MINPNVTNEYGKLDKVFMCKPFMGLPEAAAQLAFGPDERIPRLINGYEEFEKTLQDNGTEIIYARPLPTVQGQMYTRDRSAVIGDKMLVCPTGRSKEEDYWSAADSLLGRLSLKDIVFPNAIIHGGDIIVHNDTVFVGQGGIGTAREGLEIIKKNFGEKFNVIPIRMLRQDNGQPFVHLDTLFNPISERQALIHADGIEDKSLHAIEDRFDLLSIDKQEQMYLGTNVLSLGNRAVVSQKMHSRINSKLQERGFSVKAIDFSDALIMQGAFRCATAPMVREP